MLPDERLALDNCNREPVHIPGRIQPFGAMLGFELKSGEVRYQSDNFGAMFYDDATRIGDNYAEVLGNRELIHSVRGSLGLPTIRHQRDRVGVFDLNGRRTDVAVYSTAETAVLEFELNRQVADRPQSPVSMVQSMMSAVAEGAGVVPLLDACVLALRMLSGHDRVMAYKFLNDGAGEVVAEAKGPGIEPYLGLRYPAADIPTQVRQIMLRAPFRIIEDTNAEPSGLLTLPESPPLDMTLSHLRGVSPIHIEYLENMGVRSTMNVSIIVRGQLWGLFAFHHHRPRPIAPDQRSICELFGQLASMMVQQEEERGRMNARQRTRSTITAMETAGSDAISVARQMSDDLIESASADGMGILSEEDAELFGETVSQQACRSLMAQATDEVVAIESLSAVSETLAGSLGKTAGALLLKLPGDTWLAFFRNEVVHEIRWAGDKQKEISFGPNGPRLHPRSSFAEYTESVSGRCHPWTETDLNAASDICRELWRIVQGDAAEQSRQLARQKRYQDLLIAELNHRVRNTLALVRSIARQTKASSTSIEQYIERLEQRITALSVAHDLIGGSGLQWARISDLLRSELRPYETDQHKVSAVGPPIAVRADVAPLLALLFHEMVSNAVKHGALSERGGSLDVDWENDSGGVSIRWQERLLDDLREPDHRGFGFALIERALPYECNGRSSIEFSKRQLTVSFWLPAEAVDRLAEQAPEIATDRPETPTSERLNLAGIDAALVLEDNLVLAMELERTLLELGVADVETLPTTELAEAAVQKTRFDVAVLDVNLGENTSLEFAQRIHEDGTPVVLTSGYDSHYQLTESLAGIPRIAKPIGRVALVDAIRRAMEETKR